MSARLDAAFGKNRAALVTYVMAGDPDADATHDILDALVEGGADVIELGMPFTDPMADGPAIQAGAIRALDAGMTLAGTLDVAKAFRGRHPDVPLILMGYLNPILAMGAGFRDAVLDAGVDGLIIVDLPPEEDAEIGATLREAGLHLIRLATPTTDAARLPAVLDGASGFLYYVSVAGITGTRSAVADEVGEAVAAIKRQSDLPVAVGFGIKTPEQAADFARVADGVVVGSAIVDLIGQHGTQAAAPVRAYVQSLSRAIETAA